MAERTDETIEEQESKGLVWRIRQDGDVIAFIDDGKEKPYNYRAVEHPENFVLIDRDMFQGMKLEEGQTEFRYVSRTFIDQNGVGQKHYVMPLS